MIANHGGVSFGGASGDVGQCVTGWPCLVSCQGRDLCIGKSVQWWDKVCMVKAVNFCLLGFQMFVTLSEYWFREVEWRSGIMTS